MLADPGVVAARMVGNPVEDYLHAGFVDGTDKGAEVVERAEFGIDRLVVGHGIVAAKRAFSVDLRDRMNGHQPQYVHSEFTQTGNVILKRSKGPFGSVLTDIYLVDHGIARPFGMNYRGGVRSRYVGNSRIAGLMCAACRGRQCACKQDGEYDAFHLFLFLIFNRDFAGYGIIQRNKSFCSDHAGNHLDLVVEQIHQMFVVARIEFYEHGVWSRGEMAFHNFLDFLKFGNYIAVHGAAFEVDTYISACRVAENLRIDMIAGSCYNLEVYHALQTLVYGGA